MIIDLEQALKANSTARRYLIRVLEQDDRVWNGTKRQGGWLVTPPEEYPGKLIQGRYAYQARVLAWFVLGRALRDREVVVHKDRDSTNNDVENLFIAERSDMAAWKSLNLKPNKRCKRCGRRFRVNPSALAGRKHCSAGCNRVKDSGREAKKSGRHYLQKFRPYVEKFKEVRA